MIELEQFLKEEIPNSRLYYMNITQTEFGLCIVDGLTISELILIEEHFNYSFDRIDHQSGNSIIYVFSKND